MYDRISLLSKFFFTHSEKDEIVLQLDLERKIFNRDGTRTRNPQIRSLVPYPLGHTVLLNIRQIYLFQISGKFRSCLQYSILLTIDKKDCRISL